MGCWAATESGPEKSRHMRQESPAGAEAARRFTASIWSDVGRELSGTAGGRESMGIGGGALSVGLPLPNPLCRADLAAWLEGGGGRRRGTIDGEACWSAGVTAGDLPGLDGSLGGREGFGGSARSRFLAGRDGDWLAPSRSASSLAFASRSRLVGGRGGSLAWSRVGGNLLTVPSPEVWPRERLDMVEMCEISDELEFLLAS